jgi:hypothetical protein
MRGNKEGPIRSGPLAGWSPVLDHGAALDALVLAGAAATPINTQSPAATR